MQVILNLQLIFFHFQQKKFPAPQQDYNSNKADANRKKKNFLVFEHL